MDPRRSVLKRALRVLAAPGWHPYYLRWERRERRRFGSAVWTIIAEMQIASRDVESLLVSSLYLRRLVESAGEHRSRERSEAFRDLAQKLVEGGYRRLVPRDHTFTRHMKRTRATAAAIRQERAFLDSLFRTTSRTFVREKSLQGYAAALREFSPSCQWRPAAAGWSLHVPLHGGGNAGMSVQLDLTGGRAGQAMGTILLWSPPRGVAEVVRSLSPLFRSAGYRGGLEHARVVAPGTSVPPFGQFTRHFSVERLAYERERLEDIAAGLRDRGIQPRWRGKRR